MSIVTYQESHYVGRIIKPQAVSTVNSRYSGHPPDGDLVSVIARVRNSGVRENFYFQACYWYHTHFTAGSGKCKRSACCCYCRRYWTHCWPYTIRFIENCVIYFKKGLTTKQQQKSVENGSIEDLAWDWKFSYLQDLPRKEIFGQTGRTCSWQRGCKEDSANGNKRKISGSSSM